MRLRGYTPNARILTNPATRILHDVASSANRQFTGPLEGFIAMVKLLPYDVLLNHEMALVGKADIRGVQTDLLVTLIDKQHRLCVFSFVLSKQHGPEYANCWMTDGVTRIDMDADRHDRSLEPASEERRL